MRRSKQLGTPDSAWSPALADFLAAYNFAKRLKTPPHEYACKIWTENPGRFRLDQSITDLRASA